MSDIVKWNDLSHDDQKIILEFVSRNNHVVREKVRNDFPSLYIGMDSAEVARGWLMIAGFEAVMKFINGSTHE